MAEEEYDEEVVAVGEEVLGECRSELMMKFRFLDRALWRMPFVPESSTPPLATNGEILAFDPLQVILGYRLLSDEVVRDYLHLILHCIFRHPFDEAHPVVPAWSLACDLTVESIAIEMCGARYRSELDDTRQKALKLVRSRYDTLAPNVLYREFAPILEAGERIAEMSMPGAVVFPDAGDMAMVEQDVPEKSYASILGEAVDEMEQRDLLTISDLFILSEVFQRDSHRRWACSKEGVSSANSDERRGDLKEHGEVKDDPDAEAKRKPSEDAVLKDTLDTTRDSCPDGDDGYDEGGQDSQTMQGSDDAPGNGEQERKGEEHQEEEGGSGDGAKIAPIEQLQSKTSDTSTESDASSGMRSETSDGSEANGIQSADTGEGFDDILEAMKKAEERGGAEEEWDAIAKQIEMDLATHALSWSEEAGSLMTLLPVANRKTCDYADFLRKFSVLTEDIKVNDDEFDYIFYTYGLARYGNMPLVEPLEYQENDRIREFVIAIDTSGSCSGDLVKNFVSRTFEILKESEAFSSTVNIHIVQCDARVQCDAKITSTHDLDDYLTGFVLRGFGGTDFRPVFDYVDDLVEQGEFENLRGLIYFTDGLGIFPSNCPTYDAAFVFMDEAMVNPHVPPWAMKVVLGEDEIREL